MRRLIDNRPKSCRHGLEPAAPQESAAVELLEYAEQTAGRIMNPNVFALNEDMTVNEGSRPCRTRASGDGLHSTSSMRAGIWWRRLIAAPAAVAPETPLKRS
jgi:hypothetical protein